MGKAGLFYYYHTFGKAMAALGEDRFEDAKGQKHDWRRELFEAIEKRQQDNGSFINKGDRQFGEARSQPGDGVRLTRIKLHQDAGQITFRPRVYRSREREPRSLRVAAKPSRFQE